MLKVEYPCREILSAYQNPIKPIVTWAEAKKHLHDVRLRRQTQSTLNINECLKLQNLHKQSFNRQFNPILSEKSSDNKSINNEYSLSINKHSIPRIEYAPIIYRQAIPTFEIDKSIKLENNTPIIKELTEYLTESSCAISKQKLKNNSSLLSRKKDSQRRLSVSSVSSVDKRTNKVYEKWPDYNKISEIVGYRIDPPISKPITSKSLLSSRPSDTQRKQSKSTGFPTTSKQIKNVVGLNPSSTRRQASKTKKKSTTRSNITPIILEQSPSIIPKISQEEIKPKLPNFICPSSIIYSNRVRTRQWLIRNHFSSNAIRTVPLF